MKEKVTQAEYARRRGLSKSYITKLKADGRLVLSADGLVVVDETDALIAETADHTRADVAERHAAARGAAREVAEEDESPPAGGAKFQHSRALKAEYDALQAKITYERDIGELIHRAQVVKVVTDSLSTLNSALDNMATRLPSLVVGVPDIDTVRARVMEEIEQYRLTVSRQFRDLAERARQAGE